MFKKLYLSITLVTMEKTKITVTALINAPIQKVWQFWHEAAHITKWNAASDDWHAPHATIDFKVGGKCLCRMEAKDGSVGFDFEWTYTRIIHLKEIDSVLADNRTVQTTFEEKPEGVLVTEIFEAENQNSHELQQMGWQAILNNFKKYTESHE